MKKAAIAPIDQLVDLLVHAPKKTRTTAKTLLRMLGSGAITPAGILKMSGSEEACELAEEIASGIQAERAAELAERGGNRR